MKKTWEINLPAFEKMLEWLDKDREIAGQKYEAIRTRLIKVLNYQGCRMAEEIADETFDRAARKIDKLVESYEGDPALYLFAIAKKVLLEFRRKPVFEKLPEVIVKPENENEEDFQPEYICLQKCLGGLSAKQREFIVGYYAEQKAAKIKNRKQLAETGGLQHNNLYVRAFRIRTKLRKCVLKCVSENAA
jgi:DNA-directed RNA polymerase specialized sigma24 family protein